MRLALAFLTLLSISLSATGVQLDRRWTYIASDSSREMYFDSKRPIDRKANIRKAWMVMTYTSSQDGKGMGAGANSTYSSTLNLVYANCKEGATAYAYGAFYKSSDVSGSPIHTLGAAAAPSLSSYSATIPASWDEAIHEEICK